MADGSIFKRIEIKYLLEKEEKEALMECMKDKMVPDGHGDATIRNIYYDTDSFLLIRRSIEKPAYKEKLRIRSYKSASPEDPVFVELKKKCKKTVFKRRISIPQGEALSFLSGCRLPEGIFSGKKAKATDPIIADEIRYFRDLYKTLHPVVYLSYDRQAFFAKDDDSFRMTFDTNIMYRAERISLSEEPGGISLIKPGQSLLEIKVSGGMPLWLSRFLSEKKIFKASFSKYGEAYKDMYRKGVIKIGDL